MPYVDPRTVDSPKNKLSTVEVIYDTGPKTHSWAVARLRWEGDHVVGIRWNGEPKNGIGSPQSRGLPTWFIVPHELQDAVLKVAEQLAGGGEARLCARYLEMAADRERERDAEEWTEGLIGDASA
jgi:hypothetical protein